MAAGGGGGIQFGGKTGQQVAFPGIDQLYQLGAVLQLRVGNALVPLKVVCVLGFVL